MNVWTLLLLIFATTSIFGCKSASEAPVPVFDGTHAGDLREDNELGLKLRWCPRGTFLMGSPKSERNRRADEDPAEVTFSNGFWIGQFEVTQEEWRAVMSTTPAEQKMKITKSAYGIDYGEGPFGDGPRYPMCNVAHDECIAFCKQLTQIESHARRLPKECIYRLPSEAEWEYACRAGTTTATAFGDSLGSDQANFNGNSPYNHAAVGPFRITRLEVGTFTPNLWNIYDMHGNVDEWCADWKNDRLNSGIDPIAMDVPRTQHRSKRGGGWENSGRFCRSAYRGASAPHIRSENYGFRIVLGKEIR